MPTRDEQRRPNQGRRQAVNRAEQRFRGNGSQGQDDPNVPEGMRDQLAFAQEISEELGGMDRNQAGLAVPRGVQTNRRNPKLRNRK